MSPGREDPVGHVWKQEGALQGSSIGPSLEEEARLEAPPRTCPETG